jgi:hypothetical protein
LPGPRTTIVSHRPGARDVVVKACRVSVLLLSSEFYKQRLLFGRRSICF